MHGAYKVRRITPSRGGDTIQYFVIPDVVLTQSSGVIGCNVPRGYSIDIHSETRPLIREGRNYAPEPRFGGRIGRHSNTALETQEGSNEDYGPLTMGNH